MNYTHFVIYFAFSLLLLFLRMLLKHSLTANSKDDNGSNFDGNFKHEY